TWNGDNAALIGTRALAGTIIPPYMCPSDPMEGINIDLGTEFGKSNYVACSGPHFDGTGLVSTVTANGVFYGRSRTKIRDITDGTSNVFLCSERTTKGDPKGALWIGTINGGRYYVLFPAIITGDTTLINGSSVQVNYSPSSTHVGGCHFLFADGRVRFLSENIDATTYQRLSAINDGFVLGEY
ncbi:hypothetical protein MNBD_PLANCTO02-2714, partial [hydrothermal vent metagenome]